MNHPQTPKIIDSKHKDDIKSNKDFISLNIEYNNDNIKFDETNMVNFDKEVEEFTNSTLSKTKIEYKPTNNSEVDTTILAFNSLEELKDYEKILQNNIINTNNSPKRLLSLKRSKFSPVHNTSPDTPFQALKKAREIVNTQNAKIIDEDAISSVKHIMTSEDSDEKILLFF
ncbi:hypothetical protein ACTFIR_009591 [Dictyostelium discoideum]